ncbi:hypothetical protein D9758_008752 [Tetrapyrgos nigripes]|uniref:Uncharacterized protein n=1 Tax=Tetrapyrgos nigripes TaxID=182062 RepID=A0A8H5D4I0_9AGAR|nr:hypothetical protein D9758_008752 [Tetrapyrgos nigripes]
MSQSLKFSLTRYSRRREAAIQLSPVSSSPDNESCDGEEAGSSGEDTSDYTPSSETQHTIHPTQGQVRTTRSAEHSIPRRVLPARRRQTLGDVPPKLFGASTTVVGSKVYLFGGRGDRDGVRQIFSDLYVFDLESLIWERIKPFSQGEAPTPRYFHSADTWDNKLVIFGGMGDQPFSSSEFCTLSDVRFFDLGTRRWLPIIQSSPSAPQVSIPQARYAHISSVISNQLVIIGGQDLDNNWLEDICVYNLSTRTWKERRQISGCFGAYRSLAASSEDKIYLYNNYNFTEVKRELLKLSVLSDAHLTIQDLSSPFTSGTVLPSGLRFPRGAIAGTHLIMTGTYYAQNYCSCSVWALDLVAMTWSRFDLGAATKTGSWFGCCFWKEHNKLLIFGDWGGKMVKDYNQRLLSWDHVLEAGLDALEINVPSKMDKCIHLGSVDNEDVDEEGLISADTVIKRLESMIGDRNEYQRLLEQQGTLAQSLLDLLQTLCDHPDVEKRLRSKISTAMLRLSKNSGLYPSCLALNNVQKIGDHPVTAGGFGEIWKGLLGGEVSCLKVVKIYGDSEVQKLMKEFLKEAIVWRQLDHPNVLPFLGLYFLDASKQRICLISPWMDNGNLNHYLADGSHGYTDRLTLAYDVACGLAYLHGEKIIHGDLKGVNILITAGGRATIADFGLSRVIESEAFTMTSRSSRAVQGTARWLAPECMMKNQRASYQSDVYAFGCIFTGQLPFHHCQHDAAIVFELIKGNRPIRPPNELWVNDEVWAIMEDCWDEEASARPLADTLPSRFEDGKEIAPADRWVYPLPSRFWNDIRHPELCPTGSELETFLKPFDSRTLLPEEIFSDATMQSTSRPTSAPGPLLHRYYHGTVMYDFESQNPNELDAKRGDIISVVAHSNREWFAARVFGQTSWPGLIPISYVKLQDPVTGGLITDVDVLMDNGELPKVEDWEKLMTDIGYDVGSSAINPASTSIDFRGIPDSAALPNESSETISVDVSSLQSSGPPPEHLPSIVEAKSYLIKSFKISKDDPVWKVLPAALKKYNIGVDQWESFVLFICYFLHGKRIDRCLSYDEKPLLLFQNMKKAKEEPVFMLKHVNDIRPPVVVAQEKHALRRQTQKSTTRDPSGMVYREDSVQVCPVTYAVAIFPYMAEQDDEFDVNVDDRFVVMSKARGWWVVERDTTGLGNAESKQGWVPAGCLLETRVPISEAVASATEVTGDFASRSPILPSSFISTSSPGVALVDYKKKGESVSELYLVKDEHLVVYKHYNHWSYVVKTSNGDRGWVPTWKIGKVQHVED